ncbi:hypothetical protein FPV67DRAFT_1447605 [Lyophyllum atratum]|nr:hypothetical protein FPV67DRAFT_1447605 [Lyophyllum atratum]
MGQGIVGYLAQLSQGGRGWFFNLKNFLVKYFVILDAVAGQHHAVLANQVAWAALHAKGYAEGEYSFRKYALASDKLFQKCAEERLGWRPKTWPSWHATKMEDGCREGRSRRRTTVDGGLYFCNLTSSTSRNSLLQLGTSTVVPKTVPFAETKASTDHVKAAILGPAGFSDIDVAVREFTRPLSGIGPKLPSLDLLIGPTTGPSPQT